MHPAIAERLDNPGKSSLQKIWQDDFNAFKAQLVQIWLHQAVKFDFTANLTGTGVSKW